MTNEAGLPVGRPSIGRYPPTRLALTNLSFNHDVLARRAGNPTRERNERARAALKSSATRKIGKDRDRFTT